MLIDIIPLNDLTTASDTRSEANKRRIERVDEPFRRVVAPGRTSDEGREIYTRARAIFQRASMARAGRTAAIL